MNPTPRQQLAERLANAARAAHCSVTSLLPLRPGDEMTIEGVSSSAEPFAATLRQAGYHVFASTCRRISPSGIREEITDVLGDGSKVTRVVWHPAEVDLTSLRVTVPSDRELAQAVPPSPPRRLSRTEEIDRRKKIHRKVTA
jgi:hypothetical protein